MANLKAKADYLVVSSSDISNSLRNFKEEMIFQLSRMSKSLIELRRRRGIPKLKKKKKVY